MKVVTVLGARPQFIKAARVSAAFKQQGISEIIVHTGQHFDAKMSHVFFDEMDIPQPDYQLEIHSLSHGAMTGRMLEKAEEVLVKEKPDLVMVFGDTNSTLAGALAASKLHIPVAHVEAGLRSFEMRMPEEINRILTDRVSNYLFCPTTTAVENLKKEGYENVDVSIELVGDVMYDAVLHYQDKALRTSTILEQLSLDKGGFVLSTLHRAENTDDPQRLRSILEALNEINAEKKVILPLHPRTQKIIAKEQIKTSVQIIDPVGYFDMLRLLDGCQLVLTDSGGLQKEAYFFKKFCVTLRDQTEWVELVEAGANELAGADGQKILEAAKRLLRTHFSASGALYGSGDASCRIIKKLV